ncbi:MAG: hypothetical protein Q7R79_00540 [bacterium]|nr:hypothetical protein [bacterium]
MSICEPKLQEYVQGLKELKSSAFPIGVIIAGDNTSNNQSRKETIAYLQDQGIEIIETTDSEDLIMGKIVETLSKGKSVALNINGAIPTKILNELQNITLFNQLPEGVFLLFIMDGTSYRDATLGETVSSFCNLVSE